jgi:hypothetical protein
MFLHASSFVHNLPNYIAGTLLFISGPGKSLLFLSLLLLGTDHPAHAYVLCFTLISPWRLAQPQQA